MIRVGIVGATGYTALELIKILLRHPQVEITQLTSRDETCPPLAQVHSSLRERLDLNFCPLEIDSFANKVDFAFCCLPHAASAEIISELLARDLKVVDFSADYRLNDVATFEKWYNVEHPDPNRVGQVVYGIPELFRDKIKDASLVANPGCFPSSALIPLAPLLQRELIKTSPIIVDSKTGVSGAGRKPNLKFHYPECNESVMAYGVGTHRHMPEIDQIIKRFSGLDISTVFTPHLIPMDRGILSTIYVQNKPNVSTNQLHTELAKFYANEPFIRVTDDLPITKDVANTNFCDISVRQTGDTTVIVCVLDNLIKGASGAAVQNFNLMLGLPETMGLL
ncbi:MAG: N-acetyl-gamma-glutamyl-phosphate reductase [Mariniblastus sp.]|jgi:N-acetyl-gamma-glutamyl-phosphate reductase